VFHPDLALPVACSITELRDRVSEWRRMNLRIGLVPTMGALHEGHLALVKQALESCDRVLVSIFVNPAQFAPDEDFDAYPRTLESDTEKLTTAHAHLVHAPNHREMYPEGFVTTVSMTGPARGLESETRPRFFTGVITVISKLLIQVMPDLAVFGEKDYQQLMVIRQLARDLDLPVEIEAGRTVRETDGLALSSRNVYLSAEERTRAAKLNIILKEFADALHQGAPVAEAQAQARHQAEQAFDHVDYIVVRDAGTLNPLPSGPLKCEARVLAAIKLGKTRLIDNMAAPKA